MHWDATISQTTGNYSIKKRNSLSGETKKTLALSSILRINLNNIIDPNVNCEL